MLFYLPQFQQEPGILEYLFLCILTIVALAGYFFPSIIAFSRRHHNAVAIFILNLLLGWTFLGWVAALVWSFTSVK